MSQITISTALSITFRDDGYDPNDLCEMVEGAIQEAATRGLFTAEGESPCVVEDYRYDARPLRPIAHEALVAWLTQQVQDGSLAIERLVEMVANYGAMNPAEFFAEMHERMTPETNGIATDDDGIISEDAFRDEWGAHAQDNGDLFELEHVERLPINTVWTIVTGDNDGDDSWFAMPGFRRVNRLGYVVTTKPWDREDLVAYWFKDDLENDEDADDAGEDEHATDGVPA